MTTPLLTRFFDRSFDWLSTSGLRTLLIGGGLLISLLLLKGATTRLRAL